LLLEKFQSHWDGPQYSIAVVRYSLEQATPAPPGYPFYIGLAKLFNIFINDPHKAVLAVSVFGSMLGVLVLYLVGLRMYNRFTGIAAVIIFLTGSTFYYFGLTTYAYGLIPALTTLMAYAVYKIYLKRKQIGFLYGLTLGLYFGFRPQEMLQIWGLVLLGFIFLSKVEKIKAVIVFCLVSLLWIIPISYYIGLQNYFEASRSSIETAFPSRQFLSNAELMVKGFLLSFGASVFFLVYYVFEYFKNKKNINLKFLIFYGLWIIPGVIFNLFIRTEHAGYQMSYLSGFLLLIAYAIWRTTKKHIAFFIIVMFFIGLFNLYWFLFDRDPAYVKPYRPTSFHYSDIRKNDLKVGSKIAFVRQKFDAKKTLLVSTDTLWRPYMYHLGAYRLTALTGLAVDHPGFRYDRFDAKNWNMKQTRNTDLSVEIPEGISTVLFLDDDASLWIRNKNYKSYRLAGNSVLTALDVPPKSRIIYKYHFIEIVR
jgi:hypothetical protein